MECDIVWLSHGGPGSGRYPKGSGEHPRGSIKKYIRKLNKIGIKYEIQRHKYNKLDRKASKLAYKLNATNVSKNKGNRIEKKFSKTINKIEKIKEKGRETVRNHDKVEKFLKENMNVKLYYVNSLAIRPNTISPYLGEIMTIPYRKAKINYKK